ERRDGARLARRRRARAGRIRDLAGAGCERAAGGRAAGRARPGSGLVPRRAVGTQQRRARVLRGALHRMAARRWIRSHRRILGRSAEAAMSWAERATASVDRLVSHFGESGTVTVRTRHTLMDALLGSIVSDLELTADHAAGAVNLALAADNLQGELVAGVELSIEGHASAYTVNGSATAVNGMITVPISPVLSVPAIEGTEVAISRGWVEATRNCSVRSFRDDQVDGEFILAEDRLVVVS